jgi:hypothetical protein
MKLGAIVRRPSFSIPTVRFTSTPAAREASSASFDMIGFRLVDHDGREVLGRREDSRPS